jgi:exodeoxyribonuclease V alpha subunit
MKKGLVGVNNINACLQAELNPRSEYKAEYQNGDTLFREGDKVMQVKNNYNIEWVIANNSRVSETGTGVFNGDMGTIMRIDHKNQCIEVLFDDERCASYSQQQLEELTLAYCISIHKSQGSEFPIVVLPLFSGPPMLMTRNLLYTAVTRARNQVFIIGKGECVMNMVKNAHVRRRYSGLAQFMRELSQYAEL